MEWVHLRATRYTVEGPVSCRRDWIKQPPGIQRIPQPCTLELPPTMATPNSATEMATSAVELELLLDVYWWVYQHPSGVLFEYNLMI